MTLTRPTTVRRASNGLRALVRHVFARGSDRGYRTAEEAMAILDQHCARCDLYDQDRERCQHPACGCTVTGRPAWLNKLRLRSESCPLGKW